MPEEAEDKDNFQDDDGCPIRTTTATACPTRPTSARIEPETKNGYLDDDGCADEVPAAVTAVLGNGRRVVPGEQRRDFAGSTAALDKVAKALVDAKDAKIGIAAHTDDVAPKGKFTDSQTLSQARADAVKAYLVKKGVADSPAHRHRLRRDQAGRGPAGLKGGALTAARKKNARVEDQATRGRRGSGSGRDAAPRPRPAAPAEQPKQ